MSSTVRGAIVLSLLALAACGIVADIEGLRYEKPLRK